MLKITNAWHQSIIPALILCNFFLYIVQYLMKNVVTESPQKIRLNIYHYFSKTFKTPVCIFNKIIPIMRYIR